MGEMTDHCFFRPRAVFRAGKINVRDAINLVAYAKVPLKSRLTGRQLIAGCVRTDLTGQSSIEDVPSSIRMWPQEVQEWISGLRYPVPPMEYEAHLVELVETGFDELPFFMHDHHLVEDQRWRARRCSELYCELMDTVLAGHITVRGTDDQRMDTLSAESWMSERTLLSYLNKQNVLSWWESTSNLNSHDRVERILISDTRQPPEDSSETVYDPYQMPSLLFAHMLLKGTVGMRDLARVEDLGRSAVRFGLTDSNKEFAHSHYQPVRRRRSGTDVTAKVNAPDGARREISPDTYETSGSDENCSVEQPSPTTVPSSISVGSNDASVDRTREILADGPTHSVERPADSLPRRKTPLQAKKTVSDATATRPEKVEATDEDRMSKKAVAKLLDVHPNTVDNIRKDDPTFPTPGKPGGSLRWRRGDILLWLKSQEG